MTPINPDTLTVNVAEQLRTSADPLAAHNWDFFGKSERAGAASAYTRDVL